MKKLTPAVVIEYQTRTGLCKTIGEFKELGIELKNEYNLTDEQAIDILSGMVVLETRANKQGRELIASDIRQSVLRFAQGMESKLRRDDYKGGWDEVEPEFFMGRLHDEVTELNDALFSLQNSIYFDNQGCTAEEVAKECYDVANFAMMIADRVQGLGQNRGRE